MSLCLCGFKFESRFPHKTARSLILAGILTQNEAYHSIDKKSVILIAGPIPFGIAMDNTGASRLIASSLDPGGYTTRDYLLEGG